MDELPKLEINAVAVMEGQRTLMLRNERVGTGIHIQVECPRCGGSTTVLDFVSGWPRPIPVAERLPELNTDVLAFNNHPTDDGAIGWFSANRNDSRRDAEIGWNCIDSSKYCDDLYHVTHWLPLPPKPE